MIIRPLGFLGYRWHRGHEEIFVEQVVASSPQSTRALWAVAASNSSVAQTVHAQSARPIRSVRRDALHARRLLRDTPQALRAAPAADR